MPVLSTLPEPVGAAQQEVAKLTAFEASYPGYLTTAALDELRATEYGYLDAGRSTITTCSPAHKVANPLSSAAALTARITEG